MWAPVLFGLTLSELANLLENVLRDHLGGSLQALQPSQPSHTAGSTCLFSAFLWPRPHVVAPSKEVQTEMQNCK